MWGCLEGLWRCSQQASSSQRILTLIELTQRNPRKWT